MRFNYVVIQLLHRLSPFSTFILPVIRDCREYLLRSKNRIKPLEFKTAIHSTKGGVLDIKYRSREDFVKKSWIALKFPGSPAETPASFWEWHGVLQWRHNRHDSVSHHQPYYCLFSLSSGADQRIHQTSASLTCVRGIHRWLVNSRHKGPVTRKMFPFDDVIMNFEF